MEKNVRWKHPDGAGGFTELNLPSSAEIVAYGAGTVKDELDNLSATTGVSPFMGKLFRANNAVEARSLLKVGREDIFDETGNRWNSLGAVCSPSEKKFGTNSLYMQASYLMLPTGITLGGKDFTIALWCYIPSAKTAANPIFNWGTSTSKIHVFIDQNNHFALLTSANGSTVINVAMSSRTCAFTAGTWNHVELDYENATGTFYLFFNGSLIQTGTDTSFQTARSLPIFIGCDVSASSKFTGYIDEFFVTEKLLHTANFTPPTAPCDLDGNTLALLHFDFDTLEYFTDDSGGYCLNLNAALSSTQKKFGSKSAYFNGTSAYLQPATGFSLGGKDCAIAFWIKSPLKSVANTCFCWSDPSANTNLLVQVTAKNFIRFLDVVAGTVLGQYVGTTAISADWHHVELDYQHSSKTMYCFFDGSKVLNYDATKSFGTAFVQVLNLGSAKNGTSPYVGYIDEFLITEKLLHTANFTPPSAPYDLDSDTLALLHFE